MEQNPQPKLPSLASYWPGTSSEAEDSAYKRSGKTKKDLLRCYDDRVKVSAKWRKDEYEATWKRLVDLYRGKHFKGESQEDRIAVNISFSTLNVMVPSVAVNNPHIDVGARNPQMSMPAETAEAAVNYWWDIWKYQKEVKRAAKDWLTIGHGWVKVGWRYQAKERKLTADEQQTAFDEAKAEADQYAEDNPYLAAELPSDTEILNLLPGTTEEIQHDRPYAERVSPFDIYVDPEATCEDDLKWICQRIVVPIERVKKDRRYKASARNKLKADKSTNPRWRDKEDEKKANEEGRSDDIKRVTLYEYWDIEHDFYCVFSAGSDEFLVDPTQNPYPFPHPFVFLPNYEVPDQFYPIGDLEMLEPMQHELNAVRSDMMNHRKRWQRAYLALRDKLDPEAMRTLAAPDDGRIVFVDGDEDLSRIVQPIAQIPLDPSMYTYSEQIEQDLELVSGVSEYQRGRAPDIRRTATEASLIQDATNARVSDKLSTIEQFMADIAARIIQLAQMYLTGDHVARITGADGKDQWVEFDRSAIEGEFDFTVEAGSTQPKNEQFKRQDALNLGQVLSPYVGVAVDPAALVTYILREGFGVKNVEDFIMQQPPEAAQDEKMIENINYRDAPPDIQRQMEQAAGYQPSEIGGVSRNEELAARTAQQEAQAEQKREATYAQHASQSRENFEQRQHELAMQTLQQRQAEQQAQEGMPDE